MTKHYNIEVKFKTRWELIEVKTQHKEALHYVKERVSEFAKYPVRIVRVVRTVVFEGK